MRVSPLAFVLAATVLAYAPSLPGGYLNWDDGWLIQGNALLHDSSARTVARLFSDFRRDTRLALGAEYLPLRDLSVWLELAAFGDVPWAQRLVSLGLYLGAVVLLRRAFAAALGEGLAADAAAFAFALHPVHVESVAWLAGRKDVLALLFTAGALSSYAAGGASRLWRVPLWLLCAHLSKSVTVVSVGLLLAQDLLMRRRPDLRVLGAASAVALAAVAIHVHVGSIVGMTTPPAGGSRVTALMTMGPVVLRYVEASLLPTSLSIVHDVPTLSSWTVGSVLGWLFVAATGAASLWLFRRGDRQLLAGWLWFFVPLLPVSQVLFPLQNRMADRYLLFSVGAAALLFAYAALRREVVARVLSGVFVAVLFVGTGYRASLFSDSRAVFADALSKARLSATPPYQLGQALEVAGDDAGAMAAYAEVLRRKPGSHETARRATNNLAKLRARRGDLVGAESVLRRGRTLWPDDPKILSNLARVLGRLGRSEEASSLAEELARRHPTYAPGSDPSAAAAEAAHGAED